MLYPSRTPDGESLRKLWLVLEPHNFSRGRFQSLPEIVAVGAVPEDLTDVKIVKVPFSKNLRAAIEERGEGFIKLWIKENKILAVQAMGFVVSEIIQEIANMIALGTDIREVAEIIHPHPTYAEITRSAMEHALGHAVDFYLD